MVRAMNLERSLRLAVLVVAGAGVTALSLSLASPGWLLAVVALFGARLLLAALQPTWVLRRGHATLAASAVAVGFFAEVVATGSFLIPAAHFLLAIQLIFLSQERSARNYGLICVVSLVHLMLAAVLSVDLMFGVCFLVYLPAAVAALILLNLKAEVDRYGLPAAVPGRPLSLCRRMLGAIGFVVAAEFALTIAIFLYFPRFGIQLFQLRPVQKGPALSGFGDRIQFGDLGRILENAQTVMSIRLLQDGQVVDGGMLPLRWRATAHDLYENASWSTSQYFGRSVHQPLHPDRGYTPFLLPGPGPVITQEITLEPVNTRVLFYLPHLVRLRTATPNLESIFWHAASRTASSPGRSSVSLRYIATSRVPMWSSEQLRRQRPGWAPPARPQSDEAIELVNCLQLPNSIGERTRALAQKIVAGIPAPAFYDRARAVEAHLKAHYDYSLETWAARPGVDPVEDFLFERRRGHCEYFASAMAILLRTLGIPARVATGFSGGEWNEFGQFYVVRQRHAHAWVEAYIPSVRDWVAFDPTPLGQAMPQPPTGWLARLDSRLAHLRLLWNAYVVNYSSQEQRGLMLAATNLLTRISDAVPSWAARLIVLDAGWGDPSVSGLVALCLLVGLVAGVVFLARWLLRRWRGRAGRPTVPGEPAVAFYRRMEAILRRHGFRRRAEITPREFAAEVVARGGDAFAPAAIVAEAFGRVRYGRHRLNRAEREQVSEALARLAQARAPQADGHGRGDG